MRFVFGSHGSYGDVAPLLALALGLKCRGHEVVFVVNPYHQSLMERWGMDIVPVGSADYMKECLLDPRLSHPIKCRYHIFESASAECELQFHALEELMDDNSVLVARQTMFAARMIEEKHGYKHCCVVLTPVESGGVQDRALMSGHVTNYITRNYPDFIFRPMESFFSEWIFDRGMRAELNLIVRKLGLQPITGSIQDWTFNSRAPLLLYPDWYGIIGDHLPSHCKQTGFIFMPEQDVPTDPELEAFLDSGPPPIATCLGSAIRYNDGLDKKMTDACKAIGERQLVLSFSHSGPPEIQGNRCITKPVVMSKILPRCKASVHRGGVGAVAAGIRSAVPQLAIARSIDQPDNGERLKRLGAGKWLFDYTMTKGMLRRTLDHVANDPEIRESTQKISQQSTPDIWLSDSLDYLESLGR